MSDLCPFCGEEHEPGPVGEVGSMFGGIKFKLCSKVPEDCVYEDREFEHGPRGALHRLMPE